MFRGQAEEWMVFIRLGSGSSDVLTAYKEEMAKVHRPEAEIVQQIIERPENVIVDQEVAFQEPVESPPDFVPVLTTTVVLDCASAPVMELPVSELDTVLVIVSEEVNEPRASTPESLTVSVLELLEELVTAPVMLLPVSVVVSSSEPLPELVSDSVWFDEASDSVVVSELVLVSV